MNLPDRYIFCMERQKLLKLTKSKNLTVAKQRLHECSPCLRHNLDLYDSFKI